MKENPFTCCGGKTNLTFFCIIKINTYYPECRVPEIYFIRGARAAYKICIHGATTAVFFVFFYLFIYFICPLGIFVQYFSGAGVVSGTPYPAV